jgi:DNA-directed RNA polymerase specialized sigma24 family protein
VRREQKRIRKTKSAKKQMRHRRFWKRVVANRYERILEIARRFTRDVSDAQDLAQTVILRLLQYAPKPVRIINIDAYIFTSTKHAFLDSQCRPEVEINFSDLRKEDIPETGVLDPNINRFLATCDIKALEQKVESNAAQLLQTKILIGAGFKLPQIAILLNEPVRTTRYRWYKYRNTLRSRGNDWGGSSVC